MGREKKGGEGRGGKRKEMGRGNIKDRLTRGARVEHMGKCRENGKREGEIKRKGGMGGGRRKHQETSARERATRKAKAPPLHESFH